MTGRADLAGLSRPDSAKGRLQREVLKLLRVHEREGSLPTSTRFLFYELVQAGIVSKDARPARKPGEKPRRPDQETGEAVTHLRKAGLVPWEWIVDETRSLSAWRTAPTVAEYVADSVDLANIDRWAGQRSPLILCESRSLAGALDALASRYTADIASTNGQAGGFLVTDVVPVLRDRRVLYLGDFDWCGRQIEAATQSTLAEYGGSWTGWERVALTEQQVETYDLPKIRKRDRRYRGVQAFDAVETEAFGQARIVAALRDRLNELMPEPIDDVLEREQAQRARVADQLRQLDTD